MRVLVAVAVAVAVWVAVLVLVEVWVGVCVGVSVAVGVLVGVLVGVAVDVGVRVGVLVGLAVEVEVFVAVFVDVGVAIGVLVAVGVTVNVGVFVGVWSITVSDAEALVAEALMAVTSAVLSNVWALVGFAVAFTVITAEAPIPRVAISTSKLDEVNDALPAVVVTLVIVSHDGNPLSLTVTPCAVREPVFVTVMV